MYLKACPSEENGNVFEIWTWGQTAYLTPDAVVNPDVPASILSIALVIPSIDGESSSD